MFPLKDDIPTDRPAYITMALMAINVVVYFVLQKGGVLSGPDDIHTVKWGAIPYELTNLGDDCGITPRGSIACEGQAGVTGSAPDQPSALLTVFSSMFMHGSIIHLGGNMLFLWIFGNNVEDSMGRLRFIAFYLIGGVAAIAGQVAVGPNVTVPTIGASGAVAAILGGYILLYPKARVITAIFIVFFFTIIELPAVAVLALWFAQQVLFGVFDLTSPAGDGGGVAYFAHIGGFVAGFVLIRLFATRRKDPPTPTSAGREPAFG